MTKKKNKLPDPRPNGIDPKTRYCQLCAICVGDDFLSQRLQEPFGEYCVCGSCFRYLNTRKLMIRYPGLGKEGTVKKANPDG